MILEALDVLPFLVRRDLINERQLVDGSVDVVDVSRRNRNFIVLSETGPCYLLKQGIGQSKIFTVSHEAAVYEFLGSIPDAKLMADFVPRLCDYDGGSSILVLEVLRNSRSLLDHHLVTRRFPQRLARSLGETLATLHRSTGDDEIRQRYARDHASRLPLAFSFVRPDLSVFLDASEAAVDLIRILQGSGRFAHRLGDLRDGWRAEALIHGDLRLDNCSVSPAASSRWKVLKLVDWEMAGLGDPAWDVGTVFSEYLSLWLEFAPLSGQTPPESFLEYGIFPLERMQPAMLAFWEGYIRGRRLAAEPASELLIRSVRYTAARLVQSAYERAQYASDLSGQIVLKLQLGQNVLAKPQDASEHLLGIAPERVQ
jgi:aminoglycoside phosphotransferase (APT) family kinase protein